MHPQEKVDGVVWLAEMGLSNSLIARLVELPRSTVKMWLAGKTPRRGSASRPSRFAQPAITRGCEADYAYLLGIYLGDGHISGLARTHRLRIFLDSRYPKIISACVRAARRVAAPNRVSVRRAAPDNLCIVSCYRRDWPELLPQHGPGVKHERRIALEVWQREITGRCPEAFVRGLIHSDGCRFTNPVVNRRSGRRYEYPRYLFSNRSDDIRRLFCEHLDLLGVAWRPVGRWQISVARRAAVARLDEFVGPKR